MITSALKALAHAGRVSEARKLFNSVQQAGSIRLGKRARVAFLDALARSGALAEAEALLRSDPQLLTSPIAWMALLSGCVTAVDVERAQRSVSELTQRWPTDHHLPAAHVLLSNTLTRANRLEEAATMRAAMHKEKLRKTPGVSTAMLGGRLVRCTAGDALTPAEQRFADTCFEKLKALYGYEADVTAITRDDIAAADVPQGDKEAHLCGHSERLVLVKVAFASKQETEAEAQAAKAAARLGAVSAAATSGDGDAAGGMAQQAVRVREREREPEPIRITKNLRICRDCHRYAALMARLLRRQVLVRDANRWHAFSADGEACSCNDFW
jgi:pentatricopeptide repeat protein